MFGRKVCGGSLSLLPRHDKKSKTCSCSLNQDKWSFCSCFVLDETLMLWEVYFLNYYLNSRVFEWQLRISPWKHVPTRNNHFNSSPKISFQPNSLCFLGKWFWLPGLFHFSVHRDQNAGWQLGDAQPAELSRNSPLVHGLKLRLNKLAKYYVHLGPEDSLWRWVYRCLLFRLDVYVEHKVSWRDGINCKGFIWYSVEHPVVVQRKGFNLSTHSGNTN